MNIMPVSQTAYNSKNQKTPNFKATIVSELGKDVSLADLDKYTQWLDDLVSENLPVPSPQWPTYNNQSKKVFIAVVDSTYNQALALVNRIKQGFYDRSPRIKETTINLDPRNIDEFVPPFQG